MMSIGIVIQACFRPREVLQICRSEWREHGRISIQEVQVLEASSHDPVYEAYEIRISNIGMNAVSREDDMTGASAHSTWAAHQQDPSFSSWTKVRGNHFVSKRNTEASSSA